jgi:hypothetical protein
LLVFAGSSVNVILACLLGITVWNYYSDTTFNDFHVQSSAGQSAILNQDDVKADINPLIVQFSLNFGSFDVRFGTNSGHADSDLGSTEISNGWSDHVRYLI